MYSDVKWGQSEFPQTVKSVMLGVEIALFYFTAIPFTNYLSCVYDDNDISYCKTNPFLLDIPRDLICHKTYILYNASCFFLSSSRLFSLPRFSHVAPFPSNDLNLYTLHILCINFIKNIEFDLNPDLKRIMDVFYTSSLYRILFIKWWDIWFWRYGWRALMQELTDILHDYD